MSFTQAGWVSTLLYKGYKMPMKPPIACTTKGCSRLAKAGDGGFCIVHKRDRYKDYQKHRSDQEFTAIYKTRAWQLVRKLALQRDDGWCVKCKEAPAVLVDHIKELTDGGAAFDLDNLQSLCAKCHNIKTAEVAKQRKL